MRWWRNYFNKWGSKFFRESRQTWSDLMAALFILLAKLHFDIFCYRASGVGFALSEQHFHSKRVQRPRSDIRSFPDFAPNDFDCGPASINNGEKAGRAPNYDRISHLVGWKGHHWHGSGTAYNRMDTLAWFFKFKWRSESPWIWESLNDIWIKKITSL